MADDGQESWSSSDGVEYLPADDDRNLPALWSERAVVPRPIQPADTPTLVMGVVEERPAGRWMLPIAIGMIGLALLMLLGVAMFLIMGPESSPDPHVPAPLPPATAEQTPAETPPPTRRSGAKPPTTRPSTTAPKRTTPPASPSDAGPTTPPAEPGGLLDWLFGRLDPPAGESAHP